MTTSTPEQSKNDAMPNSIRAILDEYYEASKFDFDMNEEDQSYDSKEATKAADLVLSQLEEDEQKEARNEEEYVPKQNAYKDESFVKHDCGTKSVCETAIEKKDDFQLLNSKDFTLGHGPQAFPSEDETNDKESDENIQTNPKMPFLRKGSRKEPSALHRFRQVRQGSKCDIGSSPDVKTVKEKANLEELEKMQEQQRENLQKRMEKRRQAREEIRKRSSGGRSELALDIKDKSSNQNKNELNKRHSIEHHDSETVISDGDSTTDGDLTDSSDSGDVSLNNDLNSSYKISQRSPKTQKGTKLTQSTRQNDLKNRKVSVGKNPVPCIANRNQLMKKQSQIKVGAAQNDIDTKEIEEQWQVIKCMRKRQENALRDAEKEREEARSWAAQERQKIQVWCENQRKAIEKERQRVTNNAMVCQRKKRQEQLEEEAKEAAVFSSKKAKEEITALKESLHKQKVESDAAKSRQRLNEKRLRDMITDREKQIASVTEELKTIQLKNLSLMDQKEVFLSRIKELERKIQKKSKKKKQIQESANDETVEDSYVEDCDSNPSSNNRNDVIENDVTFQRHLLPVDQVDMTDEDEYPDEETARAITENVDMVQGTTEPWLRNHLDRIYQRDDVVRDDNKKSIGDHFCTPTKVKPYDPSKYKTQSSQKEGRNGLHTPCRVDTDVPVSSVLRSEHGVSSTRRVVTYSNGTEKEILPDGTTICRFANGDIKTTYANIGIVVYYYAKSQTSHTTHADGLEVFEFSSGQVERHFPNGEKEVVFPDGAKQFFYSNGTSEVFYPDGINVLDASSQKQILNF